MRLASALLAAALLLALAPAAAVAAPCPAAPTVDSFTRETEGNDRSLAWPARSPFELRVKATDADRIDVSWGDGSVTVDSGLPRRHAYARPGRYPIDVVAVRMCPEGELRSAPGRMTLEVGPACTEARSPTFGLFPCDDARSFLRLRSGATATRGTWLSFPCRDNPISITSPPERGATARSASCVAPPEPPPVAGAVRVRPGGTFVARLGARANRLEVRAGSPEGPTSGPLRVRRGRGSQRAFRVRAPSAPATRLFVRANGQAWVAGLDLRR